MSMTTLLFGVLPLIIFVMIDSFAGLKAGIISAVVFALLELAYTLYVYKTVDGITLGTLATLVIFGLLSYKTGSSLVFKMQPVILGVLFGTVLLVMQFMGKPLLPLLMEKYQYIIPEDMRARVNDPIFTALLKQSSMTLGWGFLAHAACVAYAAFFMSNWWWLAIRGIGVYVMMFMALIVARFTL